MLHVIFIFGIISCLVSHHVSYKISVSSGLVKPSKSYKILNLFSTHGGNSLLAVVNGILLIVSGFAFVSIYNLYNDAVSIITSLIFFILFLINTNIDIRTKYVNDFINTLMLIFALITALLNRNMTNLSISFATFVCMMLFIYCYQKYKSKEIMGGGDIPMFLSIFLIFEIQDVAFMLFLTGFSSIILFFILFLKNKKINSLPLFPFCFFSYCIMLYMKNFDIIL